MKGCDLMVMTLFQKQETCPSNKATTMCGSSADSMPSPTRLCNRVGDGTENKVQLSPTTKCRLTVSHLCYVTVKVAFIERPVSESVGKGSPVSYNVNGKLGCIKGFGPSL